MNANFNFFTRIGNLTGLGLALSIAGTASAHFDRETTSVAGKKLSIQYFVPVANSDDVETDEASVEISKANVCGDDSFELKAAVLWMPEHDHGSAPVEVVPNTESSVRCYWLMGTEFFMAGDWQVKLELAGEDAAVFNMHIHDN
jgi:hypothetical protein